MNTFGLLELIEFEGRRTAMLEVGGPRLEVKGLRRKVKGKRLREHSLG